MKERIKKFYEDHKEAILIGTGCMIGAVAGAYVGGKKLNRQHNVVGVDLLEIPGESRKILVFKENGMMYGFHENSK